MPRLTIESLPDYSLFVKRSLMAAKPLADEAERLAWLKQLASEPYSRERIRERLNQIEDPDRLAEELRVLRREVLLTVLSRDVTGAADYFEVVKTMTDLAEEAVSRTVRVHALALAARYGVQCRVHPMANRRIF